LFKPKGTILPVLLSMGCDSQFHLLKNFTLFDGQSKLETAENIKIHR
jgi:hypothetical protein